MLQATAERFQQKEVSAETQQLYEKTKNVGYSALLSAGNTLLSRISRTKPADVPESQKPNVWLTLGGAAATSFIAAATDRGMKFRFDCHWIHRVFTFYMKLSLFDVSLMIFVCVDWETS